MEALAKESVQVPLGRTRCYWCILSPTLDFVFLDPYLHSHLGEQASKFLETNVFDYVHPDEVESLKKDLLPAPNAISGVEGGGVFGSVSKVRYSRVPRIRKLLGCEEPPKAPDSELYVWDDDFLELTITTSWIGGPVDNANRQVAKGAVLAFFHATTDKDTQSDNDELNRSHWTNWCGPHVEDGTYLDKYRCYQLHLALAKVTNAASPASTPNAIELELEDEGPPAYVFQVLDFTGQVIVSFPDPAGEPPTVDSAHSSKSRKYDREEYAAIARQAVQKPRLPTGAKTSCTRRFRSKHPIMKDGVLITVESVVIPYGAITFACFQTGDIYLNRRRTSGASQETPTIAAYDHTGAQFELEDVPHGRGSSKRAREHTPDGADSSKRLKVEDGPQSLHKQRLDIDRRGGNVSPTVANAAAMLGSFSQTGAAHGADNLDPSLTGGPGDSNSNSNNNNRDSVIAVAQQAQAQLSRDGPTHSAMIPDAQGVPHQAYMYAPDGSMPPQPFPSPFAVPSTQFVYAGSNPMVPSSSTGPYDPQNMGSSNGPAASTPAQRHRSTSSGLPAPRMVPVIPPPAVRAIIQPPMNSGGGSQKKKPGDPIRKAGSKACESCGLIDSPEWRKGPSGHKTLCNACGLRYARAVAKQKKDQDIANGIIPDTKTKKGKKSKKAPKPATEDDEAGSGDGKAQASTSEVPMVDDGGAMRSTSGTPSQQQPQQQQQQPPVGNHYSSQINAGPHQHHHHFYFVPQHQQSPGGPNGAPYALAVQGAPYMATQMQPYGGGPGLPALPSSTQHPNQAYESNPQWFQMQYQQQQQQEQVRFQANYANHFGAGIYEQHHQQQQSPQQQHPQQQQQHLHPQHQQQQAYGQPQPGHHHVMHHPAMAGFAPPPPGPGQGNYGSPTSLRTNDQPVGGPVLVPQHPPTLPPGAAPAVATTGGPGAGGSGPNSPVKDPSATTSAGLSSGATEHQQKRVNDGQPQSQQQDNGERSQANEMAIHPDLGAAIDGAADSTSG